jgi:glucokinase
VTVVALDIGGTNLRVAAVAADGAIRARRTAPTESRRGPQHGLATIVAMVEDVVEAAADGAPEAIGVGVTGPVDHRSGVVDNPHTLPGWEGLDLARGLGDRFPAPVVVDNDANAAALGEWWLGAGRDAQRLAMITIGTGIGAAFLVDGVVQRAPDGRHGEAGHQILDPDGPRCYCGARGCWEQLAAGPALPRLAAAAGLDVASGPELTAAARAGDPRARAAVAALGRWIGLGLVNVTAIFAPDVVVLGGSIGGEHDLFTEQIAEAMAAHAAMVPTSGVHVRPAARPDDAGLLGAANAALQAAGARR